MKAFCNPKAKKILRLKMEIKPMQNKAHSFIVVGCCYVPARVTSVKSASAPTQSHPLYMSNRRPPGMAVARLRCAAAIAVAAATPAAAARPLRRQSVLLPVHVPGAARLRLSPCRIPPPRAAAAAMSSSARAEHEAGAWYAVPGLSLRDHLFAVPLDHSSPDSGAAITVFAREVVAGRSRLLGPAVFAGCVGVLFSKWEHDSQDFDMNHDGDNATGSC